jgi:hypothetical protein
MLLVRTSPAHLIPDFVKRVPGKPMSLFHRTILCSVM